MSWVDKSALLPQDAVEDLANHAHNKATIAGIECPSYLTFGRGWTMNATPASPGDRAFFYINAARDAYHWGYDSEYFHGMGYTAATQSFRKRKLFIPYQIESNRKAWMGDPDLAHLKSDIEGKPLDRFEDMAKIRQICIGHEGLSVLTENGRLFTAGYGGYGAHGHETTGDSTYHLRAVRFWNAAASVPLEGALTPKIKYILRSDANIGYDNGSTVSSYAIDTDGRVYTWGYNGSGQLGDNTTNYSSYAKQIDPIAFNNKKIVTMGLSGMGATSVWAIDEDGGLWVWGYTGYYSNYDVSGLGIITDAQATCARTPSTRCSAKRFFT